MENLLIKNFRDRYAARGIYLDDFQLEAIQALMRGEDVLLAAPTGAGKTVVAEFGVELALARSLRCIYTAPIKALSNQKYRDFCTQLGAEYVGLLTGDTTINSSAPILVVTTEVLRNMLFQQAELIAEVGYVVLDEVHYLADAARGPVWEEIILQLPSSCRLISLSATVANVDEFSQWLSSVRGRGKSVVSYTRPVPLEQFILQKKDLYPIFRTNGNFRKAKIQELLSVNNAKTRRRQPLRIGDRKRIISTLQSAQLLPAIEFIFSRRGCDSAVSDLVDAGIIFTNTAEQKEIRQHLAELRRSLTPADARAIKFNFWATALTRGFGAHHAGMFPAFKELTEELMGAGLLSLVYATGTLSLGIDMPVRTIVLEELRKWDGQSFQDLTATEYTQLIGRAGRRGKDSIGNAIIAANSNIDIAHLEKITSGAVEPLQSAFFPSYNTVVNLIHNYGYAAAREIMGASFAQFQKNAELGELRGKLRRIHRRIAQLEPEIAKLCEKGDFRSYIQLRQQTGRASKTYRKRAKEDYRAKILRSWEEAKSGFLYAYARQRELEYGIVIAKEPRRLRIINIYGKLIWLAERDLSSHMRCLGKIPLPFGISLKNRQLRNEIAEEIFAIAGERLDLGSDSDLLESWSRFSVPNEPELVQNPVHSCPDLPAHMRRGQEYITLCRRAAQLEEKAEKFADSVAIQFDATAEVLKELGYLQEATPGELKLAGGAQLLRGIHNEQDLLLTLSLNEAALAQLQPAEFAGVCAAFLGDRRLAGIAPHQKALRAAWQAILRNYDFLHAQEEKQHLELTAEPNPGGIEAFYAWAQKAPLAEVLAASHLEVGDFISAARRLLDLLGQLQNAGNGFWLGASAQAAIKLVRRWEWL